MSTFWTAVVVIAVVLALVATYYALKPQKQ
jgi:hypothetical protein